MKKSIFAVFLILAVCASLSIAQTKRRTVTRTVKRTTAKGVTTKKIFTRTKVKPAPISPYQSTTTASGLTYTITKKGEGAQVKTGDTVEVNYTGFLTNGAMFDSSLTRGTPFSFTVGAGRVIKGWDEGLQKMRVGDHAILVLPSSIAYGERGAGGVIPPNATLVFIIEVLGIKQ